MATSVRLDHKVLLLNNINLSASSIVCCMDMITSMLKLCELATDHGTSSEYTEGLGVVLPGVPTRMHWAVRTIPISHALGIVGSKLDHRERW